MKWRKRKCQTLVVTRCPYFVIGCCPLFIELTGTSFVDIVAIQTEIDLLKILL